MHELALQTIIWHTTNGQGIQVPVTLIFSNHCDQSVSAE